MIRRFLAAAAIVLSAAAFTAGEQSGNVYYATQFAGASSGQMCTWDATHDVGDCVNAAMAAAAKAGGGTVVLPAGTSGVSTPILTSSDSIAVVCNMNSASQKASNPYGDFGIVMTDTAGCELKWIGAAGGRIMSFSAADDSKFLVAPRVYDIRFNGNNGLAADGLYLRSTYQGDFRGLRFVGGFSGGNVVNLDIVPGQHAIPHGAQYNHFTDTEIVNYGYTSNGIKLGFYQAPTTGQGANASVNMFDNTHIYTGSGATGKGIWCRGCDNNTFRTTYLSVGAGGTAIDLDIYTDNGRWFAANGNLFDHVAWGFPGGLTIARGKTTYPTCNAYNFNDFGNCTWGNELRKLDGSNGTPAPVIELGAYLKYSFDYGVSVNANAFLAGDGQRPAQIVMQGYDGLHTCGTDAIANGVNTGSFYCLENQTALTLSNGKSAVGQIDRYTVGLSGVTSGAEDMLFYRRAGTGKFIFAGGGLTGGLQLVDTTLIMSSALVANLPVCNTTSKYSTVAVSDQSGVPTYRGPLTGGGSLAVLAFCNGTTWEAH